MPQLTTTTNAAPGHDFRRRDIAASPSTRRSVRWRIVDGEATALLPSTETSPPDTSESTPADKGRQPATLHVSSG